MANGNKLYSAYKGAGKASSSYQASLYDVANIGAKRQSSAALADVKATDRNRMVGMISEGIDLAGNIVKRKQRREEMDTAAESLGATAQKRSLFDKLTGAEQMYEKVGEGGEMGVVAGSDIMAEYKLQQTEKAFGRNINEETGVVTTAKKSKVPSLAEETNITGASESTIPKINSPKANVTKEQLNEFMSSSNFDSTSDKKGLTQYLNYQNQNKSVGESLDEKLTLGNLFSKKDDLGFGQ
tara:strand:+ start:1194 stop:1913 length:720 start_codon:yes stop_codon:yes gene_type:complete